MGEPSSSLHMKGGGSVSVARWVVRALLSAVTKCFPRFTRSKEVIEGAWMG